MLNVCKTYRAKVEDVRSGDDLVLMVDLGVDGLYKRTRARLHGVDAPNAFQADQGTEAVNLREELRTLLQGQDVEVVVAGTGKGGWVVDLCLPGTLGTPLHINNMLQERGYVYHGTSRGVR